MLARLLTLLPDAKPMQIALRELLARAGTAESHLAQMLA